MNEGRVIGFYARRNRRRRDRPGACECWNCLRREGLTPSRGLADKHPDILGRVHRVDTGRANTPGVELARELAPEPEELAA